MGGWGGGAGRGAERIFLGAIDILKFYTSRLHKVLSNVDSLIEQGTKKISRIIEFMR